jgi:class 3 adenylate cyclase
MFSLLTKLPGLKKRAEGVLLFLLFLGLPVRALGAVVWEPGMDMLQASEYSYYCEDARDPETIDPTLVQSERLEPQQKPLNLGYMKHRSCWTELQIKLAADTPRLVYLEHGLTQADVIHVFHTLDGIKWNDLGKAGNDIPTSQWPLYYRAPTFELKLEPGMNTLRIFQASRDIAGVDWKLWEPKPFHIAVNWENILFGGFFAICLALSLYNLVIFAVSRDSLHFYYFLYLSTYGWLQMFLTGFVKLHLLTDVGPFLGRMGITTIVVSIFSVYVFVGKLLDVHTFPRLMSRTYWVLAFISLSNILLTTVGPFHIAARNCLMFSGIGAFVALIYGAYALKKRNPLAPIFMVAWILLLIGTVGQVMALSGFIDNNPLTRSANFIGATVEAILISYVLAFKMRRERTEEMQRRKHAFSQLEKMVYPHQLNMMKQGIQLEETMPLATGNACVLCVDMINSSKQNIHELKTFLRAFFDECDTTMNRGYLGEGLQAYGFRIKEMGDGFLCSIGFPFAPPSHLSLRELALDMAIDFVHKFEETLAKHPFHGSTEPLLSIGIAEGTIEGFFTLSGIRSYELFGKGIVLATRYESLRKIYAIPGHGHLICMKSTVLQALPAHYQTQFTRFALDKSQQFIRDDETVQDFYYQRITSPWQKARSA